jgi:4,5-dihydroxyphthalate decarboxylase
MTRQSLTFACGVYDRTVSLFAHEVEPEGIDLQYLAIDDPREIFDRMAGGESFDLSEMSLSEYICRYVAGQCPFVALPVFLSRVFRHSMIAVNRKRITAPADLAGKRIGLPLYTMSACVFIRGLLERDHGVDLSGVTWVQGALNSASSHGSPSAMPLLKPIKLEVNASGRSLSDLIDTGDIDATMGITVPDSMKTNPDIVRLFPNFKAVEQDYFRRTRIFPIMHLLVIRREVYDRDPSIGARLYAAFCASRDLARERMKMQGTLAYMMPWMIDAVEEDEQVFGGDPWPYGIEANRPTLEAAMTFLHDQHMIARTVPIEELFL